MSKNSPIFKQMEFLVEDLKKFNTPPLAILTAIKEFLHLYILDWIYNHSKYSYLTMIGGTLLRLIAPRSFGRMSEDLDFQVATQPDIGLLISELSSYFSKRYLLEVKATKPRKHGTTYTFRLVFPDLVRRLELSLAKTALKLTIDINVFPYAKRFRTKVCIVARETLHVPIRTYSLPVLMSGKIASILRTRTFGRGDSFAPVRPRDVYDLLWYLEREVVPDLAYLQTLGEEYATYSDLLRDLEVKVSQLHDEVVKHDLEPLFLFPEQYQTWVSTWRLYAQQLFRKRRPIAVDFPKLREVIVKHDPFRDILSLAYVYVTQRGESINFVIRVSDRWLSEEYSMLVDKDLSKRIKMSINYIGKLLDFEKVVELAQLFYDKINRFLKNRRELFKKDWYTKFIRTTQNDFNPKTQVFIRDLMTLQKIELEELLEEGSVQVC